MMTPRNTLILPILALVSVSLSIALAAVSKNNPECTDKPCAWNDNSSGFTCERAGCQSFPNINHPRVKQIFLTGNNISEFPLDFTYSELSLLDLANNNLYSLPRRAFHNSMSLKVLDLSHNHISTLENDELAHLSWLEDLELHHNDLRELDGGYFKGLMALEHLDLSNNDIIFIEYTAFNSLSRLKNLTLDNNKISMLDYQTFTHNYHLEELSLQGNGITKLQQAIFIQQTHLKYLNLKNNHLTDVHPGVFTDLRRLDVLQLEGNDLQYLELAYIHQLKHLNLDRNLFEVVGANSLILPSSLQNLTISRCPRLRRLDEEAFKGLIQLKSVQIEGNPHLASIAYNTFDRMTELEYLSLKNNALFNLDPHVMSVMTSASTPLKRIHLGGNPWNCDCHMTWVKHLRLPEDVNQDFRCATPHSLEGRLISNIDPSDLSCSHGNAMSTRMEVGLVLLASLVLILVLALLTVHTRKLMSARAQNSAYKALYNNADKSTDNCDVLTQDKEQKDILNNRMV